MPATSQSTASRSIVLNTTAAQASIEKLTRTIDEMNAAIARGQAAGKNMAAGVAEVAKLEQKRAAIQQQLAQGLGSTINQQRSYVKQLEQEKNLLAVGSAAYKTKVQELARANAVYDQMKRNVAAVKQAQVNVAQDLANPSRLGTFWGTFWGNMAAQATSWAAGVIKNMVDMGLKTEGVRRAFDRLNQPDLLENLRKATRGTVNDFELMQKAVTAANFQIPLQQLPTLFEFASRRARETGVSVDYLVESIVLGLARRSPLILDNLGINIKRVNAEFAKTGDFVEAAGNIINEELGAMGPALDTAADKVARLKTGFQNFLIESGAGLVELAETIGKSFDLRYFKGTEGLQEITREEEAEIRAKEQARAYQYELKQQADFMQRYTAADAEGRQRIKTQVDSEITYVLDKLGRGGATLTANEQVMLQRRLDLWVGFRDKLGGVLNGPTDTVAGIEGELGKLKEIRNNTPINSPAFKDLDKQIAALQAKLDALSPKKLNQGADDAARKFKQATDEAQRLREAIEEELNRLELSPAAFDRLKARIEAETRKKDLARLLAQGVINQKAFEDELAKVERVLELSLQRINQKAGLTGRTRLDDEAEKLVRQYFPTDDKARAEAIKKVAPETASATPAPQVTIERSLQGQIDLFKASATTGRQKRDALLAEIEFERQQRLKAANLTVNEIAAIEAEAQQKRTEAQEQFVQQVAGAVAQSLEFLQGVLNIAATLQQTLNNNENAQLASEARKNDVRKKQLESLRRQQLITEGQYRKALAEMDKQEEARRQEVARKQFERGKKLQIAQAIANGALAITSTLAARPGATDIISLGAFRAIQIGLVVATTAAQIAAISKTKPSFARGGYLSGPSHAAGGMPVIDPRTGQKQAEVEGGEVILSRATVQNNAQAVSALLYSSMYQGGRQVKQAWNDRPYMSLAYSKMASASRRYETGGVLPAPQPAAPAPDPVNNLLLEVLLDIKQNGLPAYVTQKQLDSTDALRNRIQADAALRA